MEILNKRQFPKRACLRIQIKLYLFLPKAEIAWNVQEYLEGMGCLCVCVGGGGGGR